MGISLVPAEGIGQCNTGAENTCRCQTAPLLCSITELDGYQSYMASYQHAQDGPNGFCGNMTQSDNPNWFSFVAWCEEFTMDVELSNCQLTNGWIGVQLAIFGECNTNNSIACNSDCNGNGTVSMELNGLNIGQTYYFMMDGCFGATCDFIVSVTHDGCNEIISNWSEDILGEEVICQDEPKVFEVEDLTGANFYHWYLDNELIDISIDHVFEIQVEEEGIYELCVDASNDCVSEDSDPPQICKTFSVVGPDAGVLNYQESFCPGQTGIVSVENYKTGLDYSQYLILTDEADIVLDITTSENISVSSDFCDKLQVYSFNFYNANPVSLPTIGDVYIGVICEETCCDELSRIISFDDTELPQFLTLPEDKILANYNLLEPMEELIVSDNCSADFVVVGVESGFADLCDGGTVEREWQWIDICGNEIIHKQVIEVEAAPAPKSVLGADVVLICNEPNILLTTELSDLTENTLVEWRDMDGNVLGTEESFLVQETGTYSLHLSDSVFNCYDSSDEIDIGFANIPATIPLIPSTIVVEEFEEYLFEPQLYFEESTIVNIEWESAAVLSCYDCLNPLMIIYEEGDEVGLYIETKNGCEYRFSSIIDIDFPPKIFVPNVFNPNDTESFTIYTNNEVSEIIEANIYDRWGNSLFSNFNFQPNDPSEGWDGRFEGKDVGSGVYVYLYVYEAKGEVLNVVGDVTVIY